jgi:hypothetical protein
MTGQNNPMYGKSNRGRKSIIVETHSEPIYLYDSNTLSLIKKFDKHKELVQYLNMSTKTVVKYKDSGEVFRSKYIISTKFLG